MESKNNDQTGLGANSLEDAKGDLNREEDMVDIYLGADCWGQATRSEMETMKAPDGDQTNDDISADHGLERESKRARMEES